jgi:4-diphosphocytidyl-2-C-methyl-D-erythritol kinase
VTESGNQIKQIMLRNGAAGALMSGSGPAVFGLFRDAESLERARAALAEKKYTTFACRAIN